MPPNLFGIPLGLAGHALFLVSLVAGCGYGGWITGQWMLGDYPLSRWHPGYFLPTVAAGLIAAAVAANLGYPTLAAGFALNGTQIDLVSSLLAGYGLLMVIVQVRLVPLYARLPLPPAGGHSPSPTRRLSPSPCGGWSQPMSHRQVWMVCLLCLISVAIAALVVRSLAAVRSRTFVPRSAPPTR